ncbi:uncharacterized protein TNCT_109431 [Trichonephila clavata]|uniref:Tyrosine-protein kinase ephrin type A/B receptor-like domain-containing protein n=1 Tax=Trichonephila clavata TaxID=2740835 RepID=A0A8X6HM81_TRICU|nr:uncharacterized protein TNCT_109431 [Trichonephila clavata]
MTLYTSFHFIFNSISNQIPHNDSRSMESIILYLGFIQKEKDNCPPGHRISEDRCYPCPPGSYSSGQEAQCHLCPKNFYIDKEAADSCWPCPEEKKTLRLGADSVNFCVDSIGKSVSGGGFNVWFCTGVVLFLFLIISWIIIAFFVFRYCCWDTKTLKPVLEDDINVLKKSGQDGQPLTINYKGKFQKDNTHAKKRKVKFDVDIKGSATLTQKSSSDTDIADVEIPEDNASKSPSDSKSHLDSKDHTDSKSHIDPRNHTISFITNLKGCKVKDDILCESMPTSTHHHSEDEINPIIVDSENINGFEGLESDEGSLRENETATDKQDSEHSSDIPASERISFVDDSFDSETPHEPQIRESIPEYSKKDRYSNSFVEEKYQEKLAEEKERPDSDSIKNGTSSSSTKGESISESEAAMKEDKEKSKTSKKSRNIRRDTKDSYPGKNFVSDLEKLIHEKESKSGRDYSNSEFGKVLQEIKSEPERIQRYLPKSIEEHISRHQPEKSFSGIKEGVDKKDSSIQSGVRKSKEFVDHTDEPLHASIHKQNGGKEEGEKDSEKIHRYPQKSIEEHISKDQPEKSFSRLKEGIGKKDSRTQSRVKRLKESVDPSDESLNAVIQKRNGGKEEVEKGSERTHQYSQKGIERHISREKPEKRFSKIKKGATKKDSSTQSNVKRSKEFVDPSDESLNASIQKQYEGKEETEKESDETYKYPKASIEEHISKHQPEKGFSGIKKGVDKKDSRTQSSGRRVKEFVDHSDESLNAVIQKQNGGNEEFEKESEKNHQYPQKSIERHISREKPEKRFAAIKKEAAKKDSSTQSSVKRSEEFVDHSDESLSAVIQKQDGGKEEDEKKSEQIHQYPQKGIEGHIYRDQPEKSSSGTKMASAKKDSTHSSVRQSKERVDLSDESLNALIQKQIEGKEEVEKEPEKIHHYPQKSIDRHISRHQHEKSLPEIKKEVTKKESSTQSGVRKSKESIDHIDEPLSTSIQKQYGGKEETEKESDESETYQKPKEYIKGYISKQKPEKSFSGIKMGPAKKDSKTYSSVRPVKELVDRSDEPLNALIQKQNGGKEEVGKETEKIHEYPQKSIDRHISRYEPERRLPGMKMEPVEQISSTHFHVRRSKEILAHSIEPLNALIRKQNGGLSLVNGSNAFTKLLQKSQEASSVSQDDKSIRITIEPDQDESKLPEKIPSAIPHIIFPQQSKSVTKPTSCSLHQDSETPHCHVEITLFHLFD